MKKYYSILLVLILPYISLAQIKIEERVEIKPQIIQPNYPSPQYTPCGPYPEEPSYYQVIWNDGWLYLDPAQQVFTFQGKEYESLDAAHYYNVVVTQGSEYCWIQKSGYTDPNTGEFIEPEVIGDQLLNISGQELMGTGPLQLNWCPIRERENPSKYIMLFERDIPQGTDVVVSITDLTIGETINYHTIVQTPFMVLSVPQTEDTLFHYYGRWIDVFADKNESYYEGNPYCWRCGGAFPSSVTFTLEVLQGQEYGVLYDVETDETGLSFSNIITESGSYSLFSYEYGNRFKFIADGIQPDSLVPGTVTIRCTPSDAVLNTVEFSFPVAYNEYPPEQGILVQFAKPQLAPGDTTQIILKRRNPDGTLEDFSQWDSFEIGMIEGCEAGEILIGGSLGVYFEEAYQPIYFVASSNLTETDTVVVRVGLIEGIETRPVNIGGEEKEFVVEGMKKKIEEPNSPGDNPTISCIPYVIERDYAGNGGVVVGDACEEEIVICNNPQPQIFDQNSIEVYRENEHFYTGQYDPLGNEIFYIVQGCQLKKKFEESDAVIHGFTIVMPGLPLAIDPPPLPEEYWWRPSMHIELGVCLVENENRWLITIKNLRIPIFSSACIEGLIDLEDGTNTSLLDQNITSKSIYNKVIRDLNFWYKGSYSQKKKYTPTYAFKQGIEAHEAYHAGKDSLEIESLFNKYFQVFFNVNEPKSKYPCPEDLIASIGSGVETRVNQEIETAIYRFSHLAPWEQDNEELDADADADTRETYRQIRINIENWAANKTWN